MTKQALLVLFIFAQLKNVQVLKDVPQPKFDETMQLIAGSLGVRCQYCHAAAFDSDEKPAKKAAREMIVMTREINKAHYNGAPEVTCNTCHQGSVHTRAMPSLEKAKPEPPAPAGQNAAEISEAFARYRKAAGERDMKSVHVTGTLEGEQLPGSLNFEVHLLLPDRYRLRVTTPRGDFMQIINGERGWASNAGTVTDMQPANLERNKRSLSLFIPVKPQVPDLVRVDVDPQTGLLHRFRVETPTPLGKLPYEFSFDDYRDAGGMKAPYAIKGAFPSGVATYKITKVEIDTPIDPTLFDRPK